ncbi:MAG: protein kinase [Myxococcales bacterium]|nr:protein kinase [Myxococcales bacterium]
MEHDALVALLDRAAAVDASVEVIGRAQQEVSDLLAAHQDRAFGLALRFVGDADRAEVLTLEAVAIAYRRLGEWGRSGDSFWSWLYGIVRQRCLRELAQKRGLLTADGVLIPGSDMARSIADMRRETWQELLRRVGQDVLTADEQQTVYLRYVEGLEPSEINAVMGLEGTGARGLLQRSRHKLGLALRARSLKVYGGRRDHPSFAQLELTEPPEAVRKHLTICPMCRVDRRRVRSTQRAKARQLEEIRPAMAGARVLAGGVLGSSWRSSTGAGPTRADAASMELVARRTTMGPYRTTGFADRHGMVVVYRAKHKDRRTEHLVHQLATDDRSVAARLKRQRRSLQSLQHPNVVSVVEDGLLDGSPALVTEFVDGPSLAELLASTAALPWDQVDAFAIDILAGLDAAHASGHVHGHLTPHDVLFDTSGEHLRARVTGFGLGGALAMLEGARDVSHPSFTAPEQHDDPSRGDARSDVFVVGALLYELATGQRCFAGPTHAEVRQRVHTLQYVPPGQLRDDLPERMEGAIEACLKADPDARPKTAGALLDLWTRGGGRTTRPLTSLGQGQAAELRSLRPILALREPEEATDNEHTTAFGRTPAVSAAAGPQDGALAAFAGVGLIGLLAAAAVAYTMLDPSTSGTPSWRLARNVPGAIDPAISPDGRRVVFSDQRDLHVIALEGHTTRNLTDAFPPAATSASWSPDGSRLAFVAQRSLWVMDAEGGQPLLEVTPGFDPAWSPDGRHLAFVTAPSPALQPDEPRPAALKILDLTTSEIRMALPERADGPRHPSWSPDGAHLAWSTATALHVAAVGTDSEVLGPAQQVADVVQPVWLDDATLVAQCDASRMRLCRVRRSADGWRSPESWVELARPARSFHVAADQLVVGVAQRVHAVIQLDLAGGTYDVVSPTDRGLGWAAVSSDGRWLTAASEQTLWVRAPEERWRPVLEAEEVLAPSLPAGRRITFSGQVGERRGVFEVLVDGTDLRPVSDAALSEVSAAFWSPDGQSLSWTYNQIPVVVVDPRSPWEPQLSADAIGLDGTEAGPFSPEGDRLLVRVDRESFTVVELASGTSLGREIRASTATWETSNTLILADGSVLFRYDLRTAERTPLGDLHPWSVGSHPSLSVSGAGDVYVSVQREEGGLLRMDAPSD